MVLGGDQKGQTLDGTYKTICWWTRFEMRESEEFDDFKFVFVSFKTEFGSQNNSPITFFYLKNPVIK